jgi:hypothetical protein
LFVQLYSWLFHRWYEASRNCICMLLHVPVCVMTRCLS